ncbi:RNA 2',3'-cyclic phosphodiesterase [Sphingomonas xanthus]|uniref:RNA 2',3'-cyclic phosphodiesterase n=1 Tax=Sphingomonas xanthus TaxID=2594473 RepID=A0A516IPI7_9SPHN|nr:RNA 2',3'-cyclic phosphodiesterase [Sphingomonas xanthus]QDP18845.1 RNA 2',3'-cyclic phosphodiesterase [Sphingomonas xanthus]
MHRLFVALSPPAPVREALLDLMEGQAELRWQNEEQLHLTLRFIGEVERPVAEDIAAMLELIKFRPFDLTLAGIGRFDHHRRGALWAGVAPKQPVRDLAAKVERACQRAGLPPERRAFHPHITLARWKGTVPGLQAFLDANALLPSDPWPVRDFILYESRLGRDGAHYLPVATYPLG